MNKPLAATLTLLLGIGHFFTYASQEKVSELPLNECFVEHVRSKALCGTLAVPENRQQPMNADNAINLNLVVLPKFKEQSKRLPVMFLAGGPGQAATELAGMLNGPLNTLRQEHDIILVDQRGTGKSNPLVCDAEHIESLSFDDSQLDLAKETKECLEQFTEQHLPSYNTYDSIEDFEAVRSALGHEQVHIIGGSYGTRAGFAYLKRFPESIKTATLDSNAPMELVIGLFGRTSERAFDLMVEDCRQHQGCQAAFPQLKQDYLKLMARLAQGAIEAPTFHPATGQAITMVLTQQKVTEALRGTLYSLASRQILPYIVHTAANGDYRALSALIGRSVDSERAPGALYTGLTMNILCNEDIPRASQEAFSQDANNYFNGKLGHSTFTEVCQYWPKWQAPADFSEPVSTNVPVLLFSGKYDPVTPPEYGDMALKNLKNAKHVIIEHGSHVASIRRCTDPIKAFIQSASFEELDFSCAETPIPTLFFTDINQLH